MKRVIAIILAFTLILSGCGQAAASKPEVTTAVVIESTPTPTSIEATTPASTQETSNALAIEAEESSDVTLIEIPTTEPSFSDFSDPDFLQYVNDSIYAGLVDQFDSEDYVIEGVESIYVSQEYLEEVAYNSKANIFFGYTLEDIDRVYQGNKFVFTLGSDGTTTVQPFEDYDDTYEQVIKNVAIGTGVMLICVTVSVATGGAGLAPVSMVFAASAKTATTFALSSGAMGALSAGIIEGVRTQDFDVAMKAAALAGSEGFKWGAISGAFIGGAQEVCAINRATKAVEGAQEFAKGAVDIPADEPLWRQAELRALNEQGGYEQLTYLNGKQIPFGTEGATRPDVVRFLGDHIEAVEVKYYNLESPQSLSTLYKELTREVTARVANLPAGSTQRIILDVTGRGFSVATCEAVKTNIGTILADIYPNIPIEIVGLI